MSKNKHIHPTKESLAEKGESIKSDLEELSKKHEAGEGQEAEKDQATIDAEAKAQAEHDDANKGDDDSGDDEKKGDDEVKDDEKSPKELKKADDASGEDDQKKKEPTIEERYKGSTQEAQILSAKNKKMNEAFKQVKNVPEPTEENMTQEYGESWEDMSDFEKKMAKKDWKNERRFDAINKIAVESEDAEAWSGKVESFIDDPETLQKEPRLEGKVKQFKDFANKATRRGVDFEDLTKAFLFEVETSKPEKKKGKMFEQGSGGDSKKNKPKSDKLTIAQGVLLKKTDYKAYEQAIRSGKIESDF